MEGILALMIPITALMIPIVAILVSHQQKMAQIIHSGRPAADSQETAALRAEVRELKEMVHQQMLALDSYSGRRAPADDNLRDRVSR